MTREYKPGTIVLFGSGETSASGRKIFERVMSSLPSTPKVALLETPAGFELNSAQVIGRVGEFLRFRLQNYDPQIQIIPARKRGTPFSPDDPEIALPLLSAELIFMGPGSPTYAVRQLQDSITWHYILARHGLGVPLVLASAATVAISAYALPVYEIYKVGEDLHWTKGLDLFGRYGLSLVFIPHWNNNDGGQELDTSHCFMGQPRFLELVDLLPQGMIIVGIDEKTALRIDPNSGKCEVTGVGNVTLIYPKEMHTDDILDENRSTGDLIADKYVHEFNHGQSFSLNRFGSFRRPDPSEGIPDEVWKIALEMQNSIKTEEPTSETRLHPPLELIVLANQRQVARQNKDWQLADNLRKQILSYGWMIVDTPEGPQFEPLADKKKLIYKF